MATERTAQLVGADGGVTQSYIAGDNGQITLETQQTSDLHKYLLRVYNSAKTSADNGDPATWSAGTATARDLVDGTGQVINGWAVTKVPDIPKGPQAQNVNWVLMAGDIQHLTA
jgi:hypothetical protein